MLRALVPLLLFVAGASEAKCINVTYMVRGRVSDIGSHAIAGATVSAAWEENLYPRVSTTFAKPNGRFKLEVPFNLWSGTNRYGDECYGQLKEIRVTVRAAGFEAAKTTARLLTKNVLLDFTMQRQANR